MVESRFSSLPPSNLPDSSGKAQRFDPQKTVRLISAPERLLDVRRDAIVRGEVIRQRADTLVEIRTDQGKIVVQPSSPTDRYVPDQVVEIRIPASREQDTTEIRTLRQSRDTPDIQRNTATPVDVRVEQVQRQNTERPERVDFQSLRDAVVRAVPVEATSSAVQNAASPASGGASNAAAQALPQQTVNTPLTQVDFQASFQPLKIEAQINAALKALVPLTSTFLDQSTKLLISQSFFAPSVDFQPPASFLPPSSILIAPPRIRPPTDLDVLPQSALSITEPPLAIQAGIVPPDAAGTPRLQFDLQAPSSLQDIAREAQHFKISDVRMPETVFKDTPPPLPQPVTVPSLQAGSLQGLVIGHLADKNASLVQIVLPQQQSTPHYALLQLDTALPTGAKLSLTPAVLPSAQNVPLVALPPAYFLTPEMWTVFQDIQTALTQNAPQVAQAFSNMVPSASNPSQLAPTALFFLAAVRAGDVSGWLGERAVNTLRRIGKIDLLSKLTQETRSLTRVSAETVSQDWRGTTIPMQWDNQIFKLPIYYKQDDGQSQSNNEKKGDTRFVINMDLSQMGKVQVDALFQKSSKRLDLILRTEQGFTKAMQQDMRGLYKSALDDVQFSGELRFQSDPEKWVFITPEDDPDFSEDF